MKKMTPCQAIAQACRECCEEYAASDNVQTPRCCPVQSCPLWPYRLGHNPARKGVGGRKRKTSLTTDQGEIAQPQGSLCVESRPGAALAALRWRGHVARTYRIKGKQMTMSQYKRLRRAE